MKVRSSLLVMLFFCVVAAHAQKPREAALPIGSAVVGEVKGNVSIRSPQGAPISFERGQLLTAGSTIETGNKGSIVLDLQDGSQVLVKSNSRVMLQSPSDNRGNYLQLLLGEILAKVQKRLGGSPSFRMGTPTAVITVRGTEFNVRVNRKHNTVVNVLDGIVEVSQPGVEDRPVVVMPGYFTQVSPHHLPEPPRQRVNSDHPADRDRAMRADEFREGQREHDDGPRGTRPRSREGDDGRPAVPFSSEPPVRRERD